MVGARSMPGDGWRRGELPPCNPVRTLLRLILRVARDDLRKRLRAFFVGAIGKQGFGRYRRKNRPALRKSEISLEACIARWCRFSCRGEPRPLPMTAQGQSFCHRGTRAWISHHASLSVAPSIVTSGAIALQEAQRRCFRKYLPLMTQFANSERAMLTRSGAAA